MNKRKQNAARARAIYDIEHRHQRIEIEGKVYTVIKNTREIVEILK